MIDLPTDGWVGVLINMFVEVLGISERSDVKIDVLLNDVVAAVVGIVALTDVVVDVSVDMLNEVKVIIVLGAGGIVLEFAPISYTADVVIGMGTEALINIDVWVGMWVNVLVDVLAGIVIGVASGFANVLVSTMPVLESTIAASEETIEIFLDCLAALSC